MGNPHVDLAADDDDHISMFLSFKTAGGPNWT